MFKSKIIMVAAGVIFLWLLASVAEAETAADYFPLNFGFQRILERDTTYPVVSNYGVTYIHRIVGIDDINGQPFVHDARREICHDGSCDRYYHNMWHIVDEAGNILVGAINMVTQDIADADIIDPPVPYFTNDMLVPGYTWTEIYGDIRFECAVLNFETVNCPAGTFENCVVHYRERWDNTADTLVYVDRIYYAKNVGEIQSIRDYPEDAVNRIWLTSYSRGVPGTSLAGRMALIIILLAVPIIIPRLIH
jgi:hypothetical protein